MNEKELITYYNKFNEDKRLNTKHGSIEFKTALNYIDKYLKDIINPKIIDIGAGTGKYSIYYAEKGYDVTAIELVKHNLKVIESKNKNIKTYHGNAINLKNINSDTYDIVILFGPMYHLISVEEKISALKEAKRIVRKNGYIFISYCMNEYAIIEHGFINNNINDAINNNKIDKNFHIISNNNELYSFVRLEDINYLKDYCNLKRIKIIAQDGPTEYLKKVINNMNENELSTFFKYHLATCERQELLGSSRHVLDILQK